MGNRKNRRRRLKRKARQAEKSTIPLKGDGTRVRQSFKGKARSGDAAEVKLEFSGVPVPVEDPDTDDLEAKTRVQTVLQENLEQEGRKDH